MYKCKECLKVFDYPDTVIERHGFKEPPYETFSVCPFCKTTGYVEYEPNISKSEVTEDLLLVLCNLNLFNDKLEKVFGENFENKNLDDSVAQIIDMIFKMYPGSDNDTDKLIYSLTDEKEVKSILNRLEECV
jgi:hypothetical protein